MAWSLLIADPDNATIEASHSDSATYQAFLDEANKSISFQRTTNILIMDNASWLKRKTTHWHNWQPMYFVTLFARSQSDRAHLADD